MPLSQCKNKIAASWLRRTGSPHSRATRLWTKHEIMIRAARPPPRAQSLARLAVSSKGGNARKWWTRPMRKGPEHELVQVAQNMKASGSHPQATLNQEWAEELREIRHVVEFLVRRERKLDVKADVAIRRLERLEKVNFQLEDEALEAASRQPSQTRPKSLSSSSTSGSSTRAFGFGKAPSSEIVFIHASAVQGAEVLMIGTDAWVQVVSDDARAQGGFRARTAWGQAAWEQEREWERANRAAQRARRAVSEVCTHPPGLRRDEPDTERNVAPTAADSPFLANGDSLSLD